MPEALLFFPLVEGDTFTHCNVTRQGNFKFMIKAGGLLAQATGRIFEGEGQQHFFIWFQQIPKKHERKDGGEEGTWGEECEESEKCVAYSVHEDTVTETPGFPSSRFPFSFRPSYFVSNLLLFFQGFLVRVSLCNPAWP